MVISRRNGNIYKCKQLKAIISLRYYIYLEIFKEIIKRLLDFNHKINEEEVKAGLWDKKGKRSSKKKAVDEKQGGLFEK